MKKIRDKDKYLNPAVWAGAFKGIPGFVIGNGPSLSKIDLDLIKDYLTVGINRIFYKFDPTILVWQDLALWTGEKKKVKKSKAIKYCRKASTTAIGYYGFSLQGRDHKQTSNLSKMYGRGSSGPIGFQVALLLGCNPIILLGMDCKNDAQGNTDFYGNNPMHRPFTLPACVKGLKFIKKIAGNVKIINGSKNKVFGERIKYKAILEEIGDKGKFNREYFQKILLKRH